MLDKVPNVADHVNPPQVGAFCRAGLERSYDTPHLAALRASLSQGVDCLNMALGRTGQDRAVGGRTGVPHRRAVAMTSRSAGWAWKRPGSRTLSIAILGSMGNRSTPRASSTVCIQAPSSIASRRRSLSTKRAISQGVMAETPARSLRLVSSIVARAVSPSRRLPSAVQTSTCVSKQDHRNADQSDGGAAGSNGSSYRNTVPRIIPMNGGNSSPDVGTCDSTATGRPRFVIVADPPSRFISLMMRRHLALNSAAGTCLAANCFSPSRCRMQGKCTAQAYAMRNATKRRSSPGSWSLPASRPASGSPPRQDADRGCASTVVPLFRQVDAIESEYRTIVSLGDDRHGGTGVSET